MNRKGFTLIEVLAVIIILGIILVVAAPSISNVYKNSKLKSEQVFVNRLSTVIDGYVKLSGNMSCNEEIGAKKCSKYENDEESCIEYISVNVCKDSISIDKIIDDDLLSLEDYVNAGNKDAQCNPNAQIEVYRDSDFVYCHKVKKDSLGCLTEEYKESITGEYVIDTCIWE